MHQRFSSQGCGNQTLVADRSWDEDFVDLHLDRPTFELHVPDFLPDGLFYQFFRIGQCLVVQPGKNTRELQEKVASYVKPP